MCSNDHLNFNVLCASFWNSLKNYAPAVIGQGSCPNCKTQFAGYKNQVVRCTKCGNTVWQPKGKGDFFTRGGRNNSSSKSDPNIIDVDFEEKWWWHYQVTDSHSGSDSANRWITVLIYIRLLSPGYSLIEVCSYICSIWSAYSFGVVVNLYNMMIA